MEASGRFDRCDLSSHQNISAGGNIRHHQPDSARSVFGACEYRAPPRRRMSFYVYAIQAESGRMYVGQTEDYNRRLSLHNAGAVHSTKDGRPWALLKIQEFDTREQARYFEWSLKRSRGKREKWLGTK